MTMSISKDTPTVSKSAGDLHVTNGVGTFKPSKISGEEQHLTPEGSARQFW